MSWPKCSKWLSDVTQDSYRIGPLVVNGFLQDSEYSKWDVPHNLRYQVDFLLYQYVDSFFFQCVDFDGIGLFILSKTFVAFYVCWEQADANDRMSYNQTEDT